MEIWRRGPEGWVKAAVPRSTAGKPLYTAIRALLRKQQGSGDWWLVFSKRETGRLEETGQPLFPERRAEMVINALLEIIKHTWHGPMSAVLVPESMDLTIGEMTKQNTRLAVHFGA